MSYNLLAKTNNTTLALLVPMLCSFLIAFFSLKFFKRILPKDQGRAFAVNGALSEGKPRGAGIIFVTSFTLCTALFYPLDIENIIYLVLVYAAMLSGYFDDAAETPWGNLKKGLIDLVISLGIAFTYYFYNGSQVKLYIIDSTFTIPAPLFIILFLAVIWVIVFMNDSERRIPVQYAKKVVGRKVYGGQSTFLPIKVTMSGVMPVIFASAILSIPSTIRLFVGEPTGFWKGFFNAFSSTGWLYSVLYLLLIVVFAYFYMTIQYNPIEMANNLRTNNGTIPGIRPGRPTAEFISKILSKITLIGAIFLAFVAILPILYSNLTGMYGLSMGGTSVIIMVGVALETVKQIESQMMMRHYKGFLD